MNLIKKNNKLKLKAIIVYFFKTAYQDLFFQNNLFKTAYLRKTTY